jgi:carboxylesterase type B
LQGIPYAKPPVGSLRFAAPEKANPYTGTYEADFVAPGCPQICNLPPGNCPLSTSEDCLYVSVFTPQQPDTTNYPNGYPVYFWIHGGAFEQGLGDCALYNGTQLAQKGMVVVAIK